jgi:hypothetical protein
MLFGRILMTFGGMLLHIYHTTQHHITEDGNLEKGNVF